MTSLGINDVIQRKSLYALALSTLKKLLRLECVYIIKKISYFRNAISKLYDAVSAPVAATQDALAERPQSVRDTVTLL